MDRVQLVVCEDADFEWMLGRSAGRSELRLPPGGVDTDATLEVVRRMNAAFRRTHEGGTWMMVCEGEVVGLCGYKRPPTEGEVEIGFGVAPERRNLGYARAAIGALVAVAGQDPTVESLVARTATSNLASQRVLEINRFERTGHGYDESDGEIVCWRRILDK